MSIISVHMTRVIHTVNRLEMGAGKHSQKLLILMSENHYQVCSSGHALEASVIRGKLLCDTANIVFMSQQCLQQPTAQSHQPSFRALIVKLNNSEA